MNPALRNLQLHLTQISNPQTSPQHTVLITTKRPLTQTRDPGTDSFPKPNLTLFPTELSRTSKATKDHQNRAPGMVEQTSPCRKNEMQHEWQTQTAQKPITECELEHYEKKMMMEEHETHLVEERFRWSERRKMRTTRRAFGFSLPTYLCRVCVRIRISIFISILYRI